MAKLNNPLRSCPTRFLSLGGLLLAGLVCSSACSQSDSEEGGAESEPTEPVGYSGTVDVGPQVESLEGLSEGRYILKSATGPCLKVGSEQVESAACDAQSAAFLWTLEFLEDGMVKIGSVQGGQVLDIKGGSGVGAPVILWNWGGGSDNRKFRLIEHADGFFEFEPLSAPGQCIGLVDGAAQLVLCGESEASLFSFSGVSRSDIGTGLASGKCIEEPALGVRRIDAQSITELGVPFDPNRDDVRGPNVKWDRAPRLTAQAAGEGLDVLFQPSGSEFAYVVNLAPEGDGFAIKESFELDLIDNVLGFARGDDGMRYYGTALAVDDVPPEQHRAEVARINGFDESACVRFEVDVDLARGWQDQSSARIYKAMSASASRLTFGDGTLSLLFGFKFPVHQRAMTTFLDTQTARATRTGAMWVSHSLEQRQIYHDGRFIQLHAGDTFPRGALLGAFSETEGRDTNLLQSKGDGVQTGLRLGSVVPRGDQGGYLVLVATDHAEELEETQFDLGLIHVKDQFWNVTDDEPLVADLPGTVEFTTNSKGSEVTNRVKWMSDLAEAGSHAHRPRLMALDEDRFLMTYERTTHEGEYEGLFAATIDGEGHVELGPTKLFDDHISGSDEPVRVGDEVIFVIGDKEQSDLILLAIDGELNARRIVID